MYSESVISTINYEKTEERAVFENTGVGVVAVLLLVLFVKAFLNAELGTWIWIIFPFFLPVMLIFSYSFLTVTVGFPSNTVIVITVYWSLTTLILYLFVSFFSIKSLIVPPSLSSVAAFPPTAVTYISTGSYLVANFKKVIAPSAYWTLTLSTLELIIDPGFFSNCSRH